MASVVCIAGNLHVRELVRPLLCDIAEATSNHDLGLSRKNVQAASSDWNVAALESSWYRN